MNKIKLFLIAFLTVTTFACSDSNTTGPDTDPDPDPDPDPVEEFTEGQIDIDISVEGDPAYAIFIDVFQQIDYSGGDLEGQLEEIMADLSDEEQQILLDFQESMGDISSPEEMAAFLSLMYLPLADGVIYLKDDISLAKFSAMSYYGENKYDLSSQSGSYYIKSHWNPDTDISFTYTEEDLFDEFAQVFIDDEFYDIEETGETDTIAGFTAEKTIYTIKDVNSYAGPYMLEVWTSDDISQAVNFSHPFYLDENGGIVKIISHQSEEGSFIVNYEFAEITSRTISEEELEIQESQPVYDYQTDSTTIAMTLLEIVFGLPDVTE